MAKASSTEKDIHELILAKDDLAFAKFCDAYYDVIYKKVSAFNKGLSTIDDTLIADIVTDSFLNYFKNPQRYDPEKQTLEKFLVMDAEGDLKNTWAKLKRHAQKYSESVELNDDDGNSLLNTIEPDTPYDALINKESARWLDGKLNELFVTDVDIGIAHLMLAGERRSSEYIKLLHLEHLPPEEQKTEVKKQKDRIDKVIRRKLRANQ